MKRFILPTVFFYLCTFAAPSPVRAGVPLAIIGAAAVGGVMLSTAAGQYYQKNGVYPSYVTNAADGIASSLDTLTQPAYLAVGPYMITTAASFPSISSNYLAQSTALSAKVSDIYNHVKNSAVDQYLQLHALFAANEQPAVLDAGNMYNGSVFTAQNGLNYKLDQEFSHGGSWPAGTTPWTSSLYTRLYDSDTVHIAVMESGYLVRWTWSGTAWPYDQAHCIRTEEASNVNVSPPVLIYPNAKLALANPSSAVAEELVDVMEDLPAGQLTAANSIALPASAIEAALAANTAAVANAASEAAQAVAAANPDDAAAQIAAQQAAVTAAQAAQAAQNAAQDAAQDAAQETETPEEETFPAISSAAFEDAYDPGNFDIPERFSSFLNTVKSSGLFSFSSGFFNSLPGGGSPVYEIDAGQYGHHTIDLSQTLSTGLAVLKTVLLACFGFLSIRAVIMKR